MAKQNGSCAHNNCKFAHFSSCLTVVVAIITTAATSGSFVFLSIVNQVRLYIAVMCFYCYDTWKGGKLICLARGPHLTWFCYLVNFSLWFMLLLIHKMATYIT